MLGISAAKFCLVAILLTSPNRAVALERRRPAALRRAGGAFLENTALPRPAASSDIGHKSVQLNYTGGLLALEQIPSMSLSAAASPSVSASAGLSASGSLNGMPMSLSLPSGAVITQVVTNGTTQRAALVAFEQTSTVLHATQSVMTLVGKPAVTSIVQVTISPSSFSAPSSSSPASPAAPVHPQPTADQSAQAWLKQHNDARKQYGAADLSWREDLVAKAQMNAKLCTGQHSFAGENIAAKSDSLSPAESVGMWAGEASESCRSPVALSLTNALQTCMTGNEQSISVIAKPLNDDRKELTICAEAAGHFTQVVWKVRGPRNEPIRSDLVGFAICGVLYSAVRAGHGLPGDVRGEYSAVMNIAIKLSLPGELPSDMRVRSSCKCLSS